MGDGGNGEEAVSQTQFYIGMGTFEDLLGLSTSSVQVFIELAVEEVRDLKFPEIKYVKFVLNASRVDTDFGLLYYWRSSSRTVQDWGLIGDRDELERVQARAEEARDKLIAYASVHSWLVVRAIVAIPKDLMLFEGKTKVLEEAKNGGEKISQ
jgi:hypothetical protein